MRVLAQQLPGVVLFPPRACRGEDVGCRPNANEHATKPQPFVAKRTQNRRARRGPACQWIPGSGRERRRVVRRARAPAEHAARAVVRREAPTARIRLKLPVGVRPAMGHRMQFGPARLC